MIILQNYPYTSSQQSNTSSTSYDVGDLQPFSPFANLSFRNSLTFASVVVTRDLETDRARLLSMSVFMLFQWEF